MSRIYNARVDYQNFLDELFPKGAWATVLTRVGEGRFEPSGTEFTTGRVFCSDATEAEGGGWRYRLLLDPRWWNDQIMQQEYHPILELWIVELDQEHDLYAEAEIITLDTEAEERSTMQTILRLAYDPKGPRRVRPGQRKALTERLEAELFPTGVTRIETLV